MQIIERNAACQVRVEFSEYRANHLLDVREYYLRNDGDWAPTQRGISLPADRARDLLAALQAEIDGAADDAARS